VAKGRVISLREVGFLAGMRIRKKLIVLHTFFSLVLVALLTLALSPAVNRILERAELSGARDSALLTARLLAAKPDAEPPPGVRIGTLAALQQLLASQPLPSPARTSSGPNESAPQSGDDVQTVRLLDSTPALLLQLPDGRALLSQVRLEDARAAVVHVYAVLILSLLAVYGLIALALEILVLPRHVYRPIAAILRADQAVRENQRDAELIDERQIPADELGEIMRSHNRTVMQLRQNEGALAGANAQLGQALGDLQRKNHLLETAQRNLADADRLASLGVMSAGLAHEMNTPLAVIRGLGEKLSKNGRLEQTELALMLRVTDRLERLSEGLLDFARVRPMNAVSTALQPIVDEAWLLVCLDRSADGIEMINAIPTGLTARCDGDRVLQVLVNVLRNAAEASLLPHAATTTSATPGKAMRWSMDGKPRITITGSTAKRDGAEWASITIADEGPGLDPAIASRLFEPFASTRLDSKGTGLGLAVSEGIIREHGGIITAANRSDGHGAIFEILLPR